MCLLTHGRFFSHDGVLAGVGGAAEELVEKVSFDGGVGAPAKRLGRSHERGGGAYDSSKDSQVQDFHVSVVLLVDTSFVASRRKVFGPLLSSTHLADCRLL